MIPALPQFMWLVIAGSFTSFLYGYATGSNDLGNAFGTSVGSKTLTLRQAVFIASIFEFAGSLLLGRVTSNIIAGDIANVATFKDDPAIYAYGMVCSLLVGGVWQLLCSRWELNVSSTYTIIACIMGFSFVWGGPTAVNWATWDPKLVPPYGGVVPIFLAWIISPVFTGIISGLMMLAMRTFILRRHNNNLLAIFTLPVSLFITSWINIFFILTKGAGKMLATTSDWSVGKSVWVTTASSIGATALIGGIICPLLYRCVKLREIKDVTPPPTLSVTPTDVTSTIVVVEVVPIEPIPVRTNTNASDLKHLISSQASSLSVTPPPSSPSSQLLQPLSPPSFPHPQTPFQMAATSAMTKIKYIFNRIKTRALHGISVNVHDLSAVDEDVRAMYDHAEKFDPTVEYVYTWLQVFSAICVIFAHGANEVGYMAGPLTAIYDVYQTNQLSKSVSPSIWIIIICAVGLVMGLATYGYNVMRAMGVKLAVLSPSRGFCIELSTALVILVASQIGLPVSSSLAVVGGIVGVGLLEGRKGVNWKFFIKQIVSWVTTMAVCSLFTAALFAQGIYAPSRN